MADKRYTATVTPSCPVNTTPEAYILEDTPIETAMLWEVNFRIPPGHAGLTGIAVIDSGTFVLPYDSTGMTWLTGDDDDLTFPYGDEVGSNVQLAVYNTDTTYEHGWQVRLVYTPMSAIGLDEAVIVTPDVDAWLAELSGGTE